MNPVETVLERVAKARRSGSGWVGLCPGHEDKHESLSIAEGDDGRALVKCHAGCSFEEVTRGLRLEASDLMVPREQTSLRLEDATSAYEYHDEGGGLLFKVGRFVPKTFRPFRLEGGRWIAGLGGIRRVPYRLPQVLGQVAKRRFVLIVEGEKDADRLARLGFVATCNPGGAGKWNPSWCAYFEDAYVAVLPDNDDPGREHARAVAQSLLGVAKSVKVVELHVPSKGDVSDYLDAGHGAEDLKRAIGQAPAFDPTRAAIYDMAISTVADVAREPVRWLWERYLPLAKLVTLEGDPGLGKSSITLDIAARISTGSPMPDESRLESSSDVLLFTSEDDVADTIRPRLEAAGADLTRVHVVGAVTDEAGERGLSIPDDIERMERVIRAYGVSFVVIDPLVAFLSAGLDSHRDQDVRRALLPLKRLAWDTGACILLMRHLNKSSGAAIYRGGGSIGITGQVRLGMVVAKDYEDESQRVLAVYKSNLAKEGQSWRYRIVPADLTGAAKIKWMAPDIRSADDVLNPPRRKRAVSLYGEEL